MFFFFTFSLSLPQLCHISYVKTKLKPWIPQVFCHRVCLLIQSASMDPFFAHYQDQDWKKRDREGTFREGAETTQVKSEEHRAQSNRQTRTATEEDSGARTHTNKQKSSALVWRPYRAWTFIFLSVLLVVKHHTLELGRQSTGTGGEGVHAKLFRVTYDD